MNKLIAVCAALAFAPAFADDLVARQGDDSVRLATSPCQNEQVLGRLTAAERADFKAASAVLQGQRFAGCWRNMGNVAFLVYEDGDQGLIPMAELKAELSA